CCPFHGLLFPTDARPPFPITRFLNPHHRRVCRWEIIVASCKSSRAPFDSPYARALARLRKMRGSNHRRIRSEITVKVHSDDDEYVGTAARTRPLSYEDIMLKRKNRKVLECSNDEVSEVGKISSKETTRYDSGHSAHNGADIKANDARASSTRRGEKASKKETENAKIINNNLQELDAKSGNKMEKHMHPETNKKIDKDVHHRSNEKMEKVGHHHRSFERIEKDPRHRSGEKLDKDEHRRSGEILDKDLNHRSGEKIIKDVHHRSDENLDKDVHDRSGENLDKDVRHRSSEKLDKDVRHRPSDKLDKDVRHRSSEKLEKNRHPRSSSKVEKDARHQSNEKRENDTSYRASQRIEKDTGRRLKQNSEKDYDKSFTAVREHDKTAMHERLNKSDYDNEKKHHRDHLTSKNRKTDRDATIEREFKRKDRSGEDVQHVDRHAVKKHDSGKRLVPEVSEKERMDSSNSRHEETRLKRRRSKSPEHNKDRGRTSGSFSPRARKYSSSRKDELHLDKDRSKHQNDVDRSKTSNGSGGLYHRHGGSSSGLGGYSPRKRKTDAAVRTPSPLKRSPEIRSAKPSAPISGSISIPTSSAPSAPQPLAQAKPSILIESAGVTLANLKALNSLPNLPFITKNASIDSVQLTQATRPLRRLYVDNVPSSASEKDIMDCFNGFLLSAGANQIQGTKPCISCMIHKEKGQALVEFLTPEDASAALAFDSRSLFGSSLNIRRPKDFVEMANDFPERSKAGADAVSDTVKDSPHKIFVGGLSDTLSSEQLLEILRAFGPLKAFHFDINENVRERCAFLEYVDQSVTLKACAALNGMKLGGGVLTVAQVFPDASFAEIYEDVPSYEIPQHVKTLLEKPTEVLKLKNVVDPLTINLLSEAELEEILEDVRQECTRFGAVKSVNIVKTVDAATPETQEPMDVAASSQSSKETANGLQIPKLELDAEPDGVNRATLEIDSHCNVDEKACFSFTESERKPKEEQHKDDLVSEPTIAVEVVVEDTRSSDSNTLPVKSEDEEAAAHQITTSLDGGDTENRVATEDSTVFLGEKNIDNVIPSPVKEDTLSIQTNGGLQEKEAPISSSVPCSKVDAEELSVIDEKIHPDHVFEPGCIYVEFKRTEASCIAAHCLHGRLFDSRTVKIEYMPHRLYMTRFSK
ncbi:hypothetical protein V2J09_013434, partial [Rumex salicifolius]